MYLPERGRRHSAVCASRCRVRERLRRRRCDWSVAKYALPVDAVKSNENRFRPIYFLGISPSEASLREIQLQELIDEAAPAFIACRHQRIASRVGGKDGINLPNHRLPISEIVSEVLGFLLVLTGF
jgi:hypothetical protein